MSKKQIVLDKQLFSRAYIFFGGIKGILFSVYTIIVVFVTNCVLITSSKQYLLRSLPITVIACFIICPYFLRFLNGLSITTDYNDRIKDSKDFKYKLLFFLVPLFVLLIHYIAYYPGGFNNDTLTQYLDSINNTYNDWHPVIQTLFAIKLPLLLTGNWIGSMVLFQIVEFSIVIAYVLYTVKVFTNVKYAVVALLFVVLNPMTGNIAMFPMKDVSFAMGAVLLTTFALRIYLTNGEWIKKIGHIITFILVLSLTTLFRHNALLFTIPLFIAVAFFISKKRTVIIVVCVLLLITGIKYPLYSLLNVEQPEQRQAEMLGLPMTVIGAVTKYNPEALDDETKEFVYKVADKKVWENYEYGSYNYVKFDSRTHNEVIEEYGASKVLPMMMRCFKSAPNESITAVIKITDVVYTITDEYKYNLLPKIPDTEIAKENNIYISGISILQTTNRYYTLFGSLMFPHLFVYLGSLHLLLIASILAKCRLKKFKDWKKVLFIIPAFVYNYGTTLLLTGAEDSSRFFYYSFLLIPVLLVFVYKEDRVSV